MRENKLLPRFLQGLKPRKKTFKREVAFLILCWLVYLSLFGEVAALELVVWPSFVFISGAYGIDAYFKSADTSTSSK